MCIAVSRQLQREKSLVPECSEISAILADNSKGIFGNDIFRFESYMPSHPVSSLCRTSVRQKCLRYFRRLSPENRSLSCGICSNSTFIRDFLSPVSNRQFSISEIRSRRLGSHLAETGSMSAIRRIVLQKSKVAGLRIFAKNPKQETIADSYDLNRTTEFTYEFNVAR